MKTDRKQPVGNRIVYSKNNGIYRLKDERAPQKWGTKCEESIHNQKIKLFSINEMEHMNLNIFNCEILSWKSVDADIMNTNISNCSIGTMICNDTENMNFIVSYTTIQEVLFEDCPDLSNIFFENSVIQSLIIKDSDIQNLTFINCKIEKLKIINSNLQEHEIDSMSVVNEFIENEKISTLSDAGFKTARNNKKNKNIIPGCPFNASTKVPNITQKLAFSDINCN